jgi:hypothetical protein
MKRIYPQVILTCVMALFVHSHAASQTPDYQSKISFSNEPDIDISAYVKPYLIVKAQDTSFQKRVRRGNAYSHTVRYFPDTIPAKVLLRQFYDSIRARMDTARDCQVNKCVSAIRIIYGLDNSNKIQLFYQPLYLSRKYPAVDFIFEPADYSKMIYRYNQAQDRFESGSLASIPYYRQKIHIRKKKTGDKRLDPFDGTADARSIIFSFQEIVGFYEQINPAETSPYYRNELAVHNGVSFYPDNGRPREELAKHSIFITADYWTKSIQKLQDEKVLTSDPGANLAHLCPPSCGSLAYDLD